MANLFPPEDLSILASLDSETPMAKTGVIHCAHCDYNYVRQVSVEVFERGEDDPDGNHVRVQGSRVAMDDDIRMNPSRRRHGLFIDFKCELGCGVTRLRIAQHKGITYFDIVAIPIDG